MKEKELNKKYGLATAIAMVVGIVIGSGVFFKAEKILVSTGGDLKIGMAAWLVGGIIAVSCAWGFSLMAMKYDSSGGILDYASMTVGEDYAYYLGWFMSTIYYPSLTGCLAWVSARYSCVLMGWDILGGECMALTMFYLVFIFFINAVAPMLAGKLQISLTILKLIPILAMGILGVARGLRTGMIKENFTTVVTEVPVGNSFFMALAATAFAYEGWIVATTISGELKDAMKNLPIALICGVGGITLIYLSYFVGIAGTIPNAVMMENGEEGAKLAFTTLFGDFATTGLFVFVVLSCLGTCNGLMMGCTRGFYAIGKRNRGPMPEMMSQVDGFTNMPTNAAAAGLLMAGFWAWYFYFGTLMNLLGPVKFDSSEVPILTLYGMYIPIFISFMKKSKGEPVFKAVIVPSLAIISCLFMVAAAFMSYGVDIVYYLLVFGLFMSVGVIFNGKGKKATGIS